MTVRAPFWRRVLTGLTGGDVPRGPSIGEQDARIRALGAERDQIRDSYLAVVDYTAAVERERDALRMALVDLGRQLHAAQAGPLGDTVPLPRVPAPVLPFPPKEWTT